MSLKAFAFVATSLDGYISREDGSIDWLQEANGNVPGGEDCGYKRFIDTVDVLVMGRATFEQVLSFDEWPYGTKRMVVLSRKKVDIPPKLKATVSVSSEAPKKLLQRLASEGHRHAYVDGGVTIQRFLAEGVMDELIITVIPTLLGRGRPLFGALTKDVQLVLKGCHKWDFGFVQLTYAVQR